MYVSTINIKEVKAKGFYLLLCSTALKIHLFTINHY